MTRTAGLVGKAASAATALGFVLALAPVTAARDQTLVVDVSPFEAMSVLGEMIGVSSQVGHVVHARLDATYTSNDAGPWSISAVFQFPTGAVGVSRAPSRAARPGS
jgi:hypothetical protein